MSAPIEIEPGERGRLRLFTVSLDDAALRDRINPDLPADPERPFLAAAPTLLNQPALDLPQVELFDVADLAGLGLPGYLATAYDITDEQIAPLRSKLNALDGYILLLLSEALPAPGPLAPEPALTLIATFDTPQAEISMKRLTSDTGRGTLAPPQSAPPPQGRSAPSGALILTAVIAAALLLWAGIALLK